MMAHKMMLVPVETGQATHYQTAPKPEEITRNKLDAEVILSAIPKNFRNRARALLNHITADPQRRLQWNDRGELVYHGEVVNGSHITDLLKNSQRQYKHSQPMGQQQFQNGLKELNIPTGLMETKPGPPGVRVSSDQMQWLSV